MQQIEKWKSSRLPVHQDALPYSMDPPYSGDDKETTYMEKMSPGGVLKLMVLQFGLGGLGSSSGIIRFGNSYHKHNLVMSTDYVACDSLSFRIYDATTFVVLSFGLARISLALTLDNIVIG